MRTPVRFMILLCFLLLACSLPADTGTDISTALDYYAEVWNEGDLETIRAYYDADFVLVSNRGVESLAQRIGDIEILFHGGGDRGELSYSGVSVVPLADNLAMAYGKARLAFKDGSSIESWFSTVYRKTPFGWKALLTHQ